MIGKAALVRDLGTLGPLNTAVERYVDLGFDWCCVLGATGVRGVSNDAPAFYRGMNLRGIPTWLLWMKPLPDNYAVADDLFRFARDAGCRGVIVNPEVEWKGRPNDAARFASIVRNYADLTGLRLGFTSYARVDFHRDFPWQVFVDTCDVGMPLTYDNDNSFTPSEFTEAARTYHEVGFDTVIPWISIWNAAETRNKTPDEVARHLSLVPPTPGCLLWNTGLSSPTARAALEVVRAWRPRPVVPFLARALLGPLADPLFGG